MFFLPTAVSWVVIGFVATRFFADDGILQSLLGDVGLGSLHPDMLSHEHRALFAVMITFIWSMFGTNLIVFLAGMATIDPTLYDAARVDGASSFARARSRITVPLLRRFVQFSFIITLVTAFTALFSLIFVMTGGGPGFGDDDARVLHLPGGVLDGRLRHGGDRRRDPVRRRRGRQRPAAAAAARK